MSVIIPVAIVSGLGLFSELAFPLLRKSLKLKWMKE